VRPPLCLWRKIQHVARAPLQRSSIGAMLGNFVLPVLAGNIVGGTVLFALLSYAQVMKEL